MSRVVGIDLSTFALDLVALDEDTNDAEWVRCDLQGKDAWQRTLTIRRSLARDAGARFWHDVYLVAIEAPYGRGQAGTNALLNRVVGAIVSALPTELRAPERCWIVRPDEWKTGLELKGKPSGEDLERLTGTRYPFTGSEYREPANEHARDAYCIAMWARDTNARAIEKHKATA